MSKVSLITALFLICFGFQAKAQLGFCNGSKGDPIFQEDFGQGSGTGNELGTAITSYNFVRQDPQDGEYTVADDIGNTINSWHSFIPQTTISGGRALIVNADYNAGRFYKKEISGLCENTTYEFSAFLMNIYNKGNSICPQGGIPINVKFEIWDETDSNLLKSGDTGNINSTNAPNWVQYALTFQSEPDQDAIILKMYNNADGGCGNDLAIDDIIFRSCGDLTEITASQSDSGSLSVCEENSPVSTILTAEPDNSVYEDHFYQWQKSLNAQDWQDISGANSASYQTGSINITTYFRVKVAEDIANISSNECSSASEAFEIKIIQKPLPPVSNGNTTICGNETVPELSVSAEDGVTINWYDSEIDGNLLATDTNSFIPDSEGTFYAEALNPDFDCGASIRTPVTLSINTVPVIEDEELQICPDSELVITAGASGFQYLWNTGETSESIIITTSGSYSVAINTSGGCTTTKTINVLFVDNAQISEIESAEDIITIVPETEGQFLYSIDGENYQESNIFNAIPGGIYTAYIKDTQGCKLTTREFSHIVIPEFITPNNDGYNDNFQLKGVEFFDFSEIRIFDRYGKLLKIDAGENFSWDGKLDGIDLPAEDYWYLIKISGFEDQSGHFSLIR